MKKILFLISVLTISLNLSSCGVQQPFAPTISLLHGNAAMPFAEQQGMLVATDSVYNVKLDWDISNTGAMGAKVIIANAEDYYCEKPITAKTFFITNTANISTNPFSSLGHMFDTTPNIFQYGKTYAICLASVWYNNVSRPSPPVFLEITSY